MTITSQRLPVSPLYSARQRNNTETMEKSEKSVVTDPRLSVSSSYSAGLKNNDGTFGKSVESAFGNYLDVELQRKKMSELKPGQMLPSVYMQFMEDYRNWKAQQPETVLPDSQGWTEENLEFLRERYSGDLSAFEIYDALDTMQKMGMLSENGKLNAAGSGMVQLDITKDINVLVAGNFDANSTASWLHGFDKAPMVGFHNLEDIMSWAKEYRDEDYPDFITHAEALARGWI